MPDRIVLHVDMDAFYARVEKRDRPELADRPVVVGADPDGGAGRGVVATAGYEARDHGIHSAQPISRAWERAPEETAWLRPRISYYSQVGERIFDDVAGMVDVFEATGIDEAYADVTATCDGDREAAATLADRIRARVRDEHGLTCSVGVAPNKLVAKIASDLDKPDGRTVVAPGEVADLIGPLDVDAIPGVGPKTRARLEEIGVATVADLADRDPEPMADRFGKRGPVLVRRARGEDDRPVDPDHQRKSVGTETTFGEDLPAEKAREALRDVVDGAVRRLWSTGFQGRTVTLKVRQASFDTYTRSRTLPGPVDDADVLEEVAGDLFAQAPTDAALRLLGLRISNLDRSRTRQATLDEYV